MPKKSVSLEKFRMAEESQYFNLVFPDCTTQCLGNYRVQGSSELGVKVIILILSVVIDLIRTRIRFILHVHV